MLHVFDILLNWKNILKLPITKKLQSNWSSGFTEAINRDLIFQFVFNGNWKEIGRKKLRKLERNWKIIGGSRFTVYWSRTVNGDKGFGGRVNHE